jgi:DNA-binding LytR/AlgR family response regulator
MNTVIIDDESPALELLRNFAERIPTLNIVFVTSDAMAGIEFINSNPVDVLLLDIEMPDITGIELLKELDELPVVVFTTAYSDYAMLGWELKAADYLLKPFSFERFTEAIDLARLKFESKRSSQFIVVPEDYNYVKINLEEINYIEGLKDYVKIFTDTKRVITRMNLKKIEELISNMNFVRIHRSYVVSLSKIDSFTKTNVVIDQKKIPIGKTYLQSFNELNYFK